MNTFLVISSDRICHIKRQCSLSDKCVKYFALSNPNYRTPNSRISDITHGSRYTFIKRSNCAVSRVRDVTPTAGSRAGQCRAVKWTLEIYSKRSRSCGHVMSAPNNTEMAYGLRLENANPITTSIKALYGESAILMMKRSVYLCSFSCLHASLICLFIEHFMLSIIYLMSSGKRYLFVIYSFIYVYSIIMRRFS